MVRLVVVLAMALAGCADFDLDDRRFRCAEDPSICSAGWTCGDDGYCTANDAAVHPDARASCEQDGAVCDDDNPCTSDSCSGGTCSYEPLAENASCGAGCVCLDGDASEEACGDGVDNDGDGLVDCGDGDCPRCMGGLQCCPDGACRLDC